MNQDGPSLIIEPPPPPPGPHLAQYVLKKIDKNVHQITYIHIVELWCDFKMFVGP